MPERYLSEVLQSFPGIAHHTAPLIGVEATMYNRLWRSIIDGKLKPGTKLREDIIGETFEVSRTVVRKVLVIMEQEGIVELPLNRGAYVATPTPEDARAVFEALRVIGAHVIAALAASDRKLDTEDIERLHQQVSLREAAEESGDFAAGRILSSEFFMLLAHIHGNRILAAQFENLITRGIMAITHFHAMPNMPKRSEFQTKLVSQILDHKQSAAIATFMEYHNAYERSLQFSDLGDYEIDLRAILRPEPVAIRPATPSKRYGKRKQADAAVK